MFKIKDMILENKKHHDKLTSSHESPFSYELNLDLTDYKYIGIYSRDKFITKCFLKVLIKLLSLILRSLAICLSDGFL